MYVYVNTYVEHRKMHVKIMSDKYVEMYFHIKTINTRIYDDTNFAKIATDVVNTNKHYARTHACTHALQCSVTLERFT